MARASQLATLGEFATSSDRPNSLTDEAIRRQFRVFISRAYRRPATDEDVDRMMQVFAQRRATGRSQVEAFSDGLKAVLCSPSFLVPRGI